MNQLDKYREEWAIFQRYCEKRAKLSDCHINNKGWQKLREFHLENFIEDVKNPFGFLYNIKFKHKSLYHEIHCIPRLYHRQLKLRQLILASPSKSVIQFPTWRKR